MSNQIQPSFQATWDSSGVLEARKAAKYSKEHPKTRSVLPLIAEVVSVVLFVPAFLYGAYRLAEIGLSCAVKKIARAFISKEEESLHVKRKNRIFQEIERVIIDNGLNPDEFKKAKQRFLTEKSLEKKAQAFEEIKNLLPPNLILYFEKNKELLFADESSHERTAAFDRIWAGPQTTFAKLTALAILPASILEKPKKERLERFNEFWSGPLTRQNIVLRAAFTAERKTIMTPDGVKLQAVVYRSNTGTPETNPTVICCNPNAAFQEQEPFQNLMRQSLLNGVSCNFITFDYRSVGNSEGIFTCEDDLLIDASSMIDYAKKELHTPDHLIDVYGHSLGGAVAMKTLALHQELDSAIVSDRSFSSIKDFILSHCYLPFKPLGYLIAWIIKQKGLAFDAAADFEKLKARTLVVFHPEDSILPLDASVQKAVGKTLGKKDQSIQIRPLKEQEGLEHHIEPLTLYKDAEDQAVLSRIGQFLFETATPSLSLSQDLIDSLAEKCMESQIDDFKALNEFINEFVMRPKDRAQVFLSYFKAVVKSENIPLQVRFLQGLGDLLGRRNDEELCKIAAECLNLGFASRDEFVQESAVELAIELAQLGQNYIACSAIADDALFHENETIRSAGQELLEVLIAKGQSHPFILHILEQEIGAQNFPQNFLPLAEDLLASNREYAKNLLRIAENGMQSNDRNTVIHSILLFNRLVKYGCSLAEAQAAVLVAQRSDDEEVRVYAENLEHEIRIRESISSLDLSKEQLQAMIAPLLQRLGNVVPT